MKKNKRLLWLDDYRDPMENQWLVFSPIEQPFEVIWVKSYKEFIKWIASNGLPDAICFDHDLADVRYNPAFCQTIIVHHEMTGLDCAKWLIDYCITNNLKLPLYNIQSANPVGKENIDKLLKNYIKHTNNE